MPDEGAGEGVGQCPAGSGRLSFHFKDGSFYDDTTVISPRQRFQLISDHVVQMISDHVVQKGPSFAKPLDVFLDALKSQVTVRSVDADGEQKVESDHFVLPAGPANGMLLSILKNLRPSGSERRVSLVAATPKPRLVKLAITGAAHDSFTDGERGRQAVSERRKPLGSCLTSASYRGHLLDLEDRVVQAGQECSVDLARPDSSTSQRSHDR